MKNGLIKTFAALLTAALVVTGCGGGGNGTSSTDTGTTAAAPAASDGTLTIANGTDIESFDPQNNNNTASEAILVNVFDYLLKNDDEGNKVAALATSWEQTADNVWQFKLRDDVKFHNGDPFTAADVKYTFERLAKDEALKQHSYFKTIEEVRVVDDYTAEFVTTGPDPLLLNRLSKMGAGILPSKYIEENGLDAFLKNPIGTGAYKFKSWAKDDRVVLEKNDDYFDGAPKWNEVVFRVVPEASTRVSELLTGGVDIVSGVPSTDIERIEQTENLSVETTPIKRVLQMIVRQTEGTPTADPKVREAIDLAIDKKAIVDSIAGGNGVLTRTSVTPGNFGSDESLYEQSLYDLEKAKALLQEAGYADKGPELSLSSSSQYKEYAEVVSAMLTAAGFTVNLDILEPSAFSEKMTSKTFGELYMIGIGNSMNDASNNYNRFLSSEASGETDYDNAEVEKLLQSALVNMDEASRADEYKQVQQILAEERPAIYLFQMKGVYGVNASVDFSPRQDEMFYAEEIVPAQ